MNQSDFHKLAIYTRTIRNNIPFVDIKPYSHNIINLTLFSIVDQLGDDVAKKIIATTKLKDLGWGCWLDEPYKEVINELNGIINKWKNDNDDVLSAPVYNEEEDRMEMKCWYPCDEPFNRWLSDNEILIW